MTAALAVDGGQTGIRVALDDGDPVEVPGVSHQDGDAVTAVARSVAVGHRELGSPAIERVALGLSTAPTASDDLDRLGRLVLEATGAASAWVADDAVTGHLGALGESWGVSLVAGTGVACLAHGPRIPSPRIVDGYGTLLGDDGAGFWIGREAVRRALRAWEGRGPVTDLSGIVEDALGSIDGLPARIHALDRPVQALAQLAPRVLASRDAVADEIAGLASAALADTARAAARLCTTDGAVPVALGGQLLREGRPLRARLDALLAADPGLLPRSALTDPLGGARLLARLDDPGAYRPLVTIITKEPPR